MVEDEERGVTVRPSSSANFYVDSVDKPPIYGSGDFTINKNQSLFNGFFKRISTAEVVMDWGLPNVSSWWGNSTIVVYINNAGVVSRWSVTIEDGFYTIQEALERLTTLLNALVGIPAVFSYGNTGANVSLGASLPFLVYWSQTEGVLDPTAPAITNVNYTPAKALARALFASTLLYTGAVPPLAASPFFTATKLIQSPLLLGTRYVDIVSPQLTYNQDLKDSTTATVQRDVLYRWYLAWDTIPLTEQLQVAPGPPPEFIQTFPIYQGYTPFLQRRVLPYPKQILWNANQPIGQVSFNCYDDRGRLIDTSKFTPNGNFQFQMSMLLSEN
jgi:hypothetical protein